MKKIFLSSFLVFSLFLSGCFSRTPIPQEYHDFAGSWIAGDGSIIKIYYDGVGNVETGNVSITGGQTNIDSESLTIGLFGISKSYTIDTPPYQEESIWKMKLNGVIYSKK